LCDNHVAVRLAVAKFALVPGAVGRGADAVAVQLAIAIFALAPGALGRCGNSVAVHLAIAILALVNFIRLAVDEPLHRPVAFCKTVLACPRPRNGLIWLWSRIKDTAFGSLVCDPVFVI